MDRKVTLPAGTNPSWAQLSDFFSRRDFPAKMMMIDGALSFPDELPSDVWRELRVGTPLGMVTLRRETDGIRLVTWGNAEGPLRQAWDKMTWGVAEVFGGQVQEDGAMLSAAEFAQKARIQENRERTDP